MWPQVAITLTIAIFVLFSLGAIFWTERRQVFAIGFTATGWLYFLLVFSSVSSVRPYLLTETAMNRLFVTMHGDQTGQYGYVLSTMTTPNGPARVQRVVYTAPVPPPLPAPPANNVANTPAYRPTVVQPLPMATVQPKVDSRSFANIGHSMWAVIVAFVGGVTAQLLAKRRKQVAKSPEASPSSFVTA